VTEKAPPSPAFGNVKCPVHGEHGALSNGKCWYCEQTKPVSTEVHVPIPEGDHNPEVEVPQKHSKKEK
jgi:hypothetical protein